MNKLYPIDYITYYKEGKIPNEVELSLERTKKLGFDVLKLTPDNFNENPYHCGFKHMKEITMPKIMKLYNENKINGFFIAEGDLYIYDDFNFQTFLTNDYKFPTWLSYKKKKKDYIVGNFLLYFPKEFIPQLNDYFQKQKRLIYSDRFFSKLVFNNWLKLEEKSYGDEYEHYSNVIGKIRTGIKM